MKTQSKPLALGIDIGRVIMSPARDDGSPDTSFLSGNEREALDVPPAPHLYDVLPGLVEHFSGRVWLVSKAGERIEKLTRRWLRHQQFFEQSGMRPDRVRFCRRRPDKRLHAEQLGLTHFIDDRADVLGYLRGAVEQLYLFGVQTHPIPDWVTPVVDWRAVERALIGKRDEFGGHVLGEPNAVGRPMEDETLARHAPGVDP